MLEDDIQYMGTRMASSITAPAPVRPFPPQNPVTGKDRGHKVLHFTTLDKQMLSGIVLHVEASGGQPACDMTFRRSQASAVTIGRKSSSDQKLARDDDDPGNAGFICQVVSGRHAKLAFSDSGYVCISIVIIFDLPDIFASRFISLI